VSERLEARAEILKLSRLLAAPPAELAFLEGLPPAALRKYREAATERLFDADASMFRRVGSAARLLPSALIATVAQRAFGPLLCARAAGYVETTKALDVLGRLPPEFVADATVEVDPRRVAELIAGATPEVVVPVANILGERREYVTMGRFLAYVPDHTIASAIGALSDEALLRTAFVLEHKERLDQAVGLLPADRLPGVIVCASELGLWSEALDLLDHLSDERRAPIGDVFAQQAPDVIGELVAAVSAAGMWDSLLPVVRVMSEQSLGRLVAVPAFHDPAVLAEIIEAAADSEAGLWRDLAPLVRALPAEVHDHAAAIASRLDEQRLARIVRGAAEASEAIAPLVSLIAAMDDGGRRKIGEVVAAADPEVLSAIIAAVARDRLLSELAPLLAVLSSPTVAALAEAAADLADEHVISMLEDAVATPEALTAFIAIAEEMPETDQQRVAAVIEAAPDTLVRDVLDRVDGSLLDRLPPIIRAAVPAATAPGG
jgi:hypothetical protein